MSGSAILATEKQKIPVCTAEINDGICVLCQPGKAFAEFLIDVLGCGMAVFFEANISSHCRIVFSYLFTLTSTFWLGGHTHQDFPHASDLLMFYFITGI